MNPGQEVAKLRVSIACEDLLGSYPGRIHLLAQVLQKLQEGMAPDQLMRVPKGFVVPNALKTEPLHSELRDWRLKSDVVMSWILALKEDLAQLPSHPNQDHHIREIERRLQCPIHQTQALFQQLQPHIQEWQSIHKA